jgi:hypothetical protein
MELQGQEDTEPKLGYGNCQWLYPHDEPQEKSLDEPDYASDKPVYYAARYGDAEENVYTFVIDESGGPGAGYDVVYIDANNDNRLDPQEERFEFRVGNPAHADPVRIRLLVAAGGVTAPYHVNFKAFTYSSEKHPVEKIHANLRNSSYYAGEAWLRGNWRKIAVADLDSTGLFNDVEQGLFDGDRFFVDLNEDGRLHDDRDRQESFPYGKYTRIAGDWYSIVASPDGSRVEIARADPPLGKVEAPPRISKALLVSATQPLYLDFGAGPDPAVAGTYRTERVVLLARDEPPTGFQLSGRFGDDGPELTIRQGQTARLKAGSPLTVEAEAVPKDEEGTLDFSLEITGVGGERYRWRQKDRSSPKAGFEIVDSSGEVVAAEEFEYG